MIPETNTTETMPSPVSSVATDRQESLPAPPTEDNGAHMYISDAVAPGSAKSFCAQLSQLRATIINVHIDSNGGCADDGLAIYDALLKYPGEVVVHIDGVCGSICPVIAMAGRSILMAEDAVIGLHQGSATISGTLDQLWAELFAFTQIDNRIVDIFASRSNRSAEAIRALIRHNVTLNAKAALELGLCTEIVPAKGLAANWDISQ